PSLYHLLFQNGIIIKDIKHWFFTQSLPPPQPGDPPQTHHFDSQVDMQVSTDSGKTLSPVQASAGVDVTVTHRLELNSGGQRVEVYDTEMTAMNMQFLAFANGPTVMIRESPTLRSEGGTAIEPQPDGTARIHSFFD